MDGLIGLDRYSIDVYGEHDTTGSGQPAYTRDSLDALLRWYDDYRVRNGSGTPMGLVRMTAHLVAPLDYPRGFEELNESVNVQYDGALLVIGARTVESLIETYNYVMRWQPAPAETA